MEDMLWKFPHIGENIFKKLSKKNLVKCLKVKPSWEQFITNENFYKQRVQYEMMQKEKTAFGETPLHHAAFAGNLSECNMIIDHVEDKNPEDNFGCTPLHHASRNQHYHIAEYIKSVIQQI